MIAAAKKILVGIVGGLVLLAGIVMIVTPGPAVLVIPIGLGILATEFAWARAYKEKLEQKWSALRNRRKNAVE